MSDELEARMWDDGAFIYESRSRESFFESGFASSEHLDRAPLLSEETYTEVPVEPLADTDDHCHWKQVQPPSAVPKLVVALVLCGFFVACELVGGYLAGSLSVMCDAAHMLSDCGGFALALIAFHCAKRGPDVKMSYGYKRAEVLGAMTSVLMIMILTGVFVYVAITRLHSGEFDLDPDIMMIVSGCGVAFNVILVLVLHGCSSDLAHHHTHGGAACTHHPHAHSHQTDEPTFRLFRRDRKQNGIINGDYSMKEIASTETTSHAPNTRNINLRAALIHVIGDLIQSCGVLLASIVIKFYPDLKIIDPICTFVFSILVVWSSTGVIKDAVCMLMQAVPTHFRYRECVAALSSVSGVRHVHSLHVWALSTHYTVLTAHLAIDELGDGDSILRECQNIARVDFNVQSATFQVERYSPRMLTCAQCRHQPALQPPHPTTLSH